MMTEETHVRRNIDRPECPRSTSFTVAFCANPACGVHLIGYDEDGEAVLETALSRKQTEEMMRTCAYEFHLRDHPHGDN